MLQVLREFDGLQQILIQLLPVLADLFHIHHLWIAQDFFNLWPLLLVVGHQFGHKRREFFGVRAAYLLVLSYHDLLEELVGSVSSEWWLEHGHLIEHTP